MTKSPRTATADLLGIHSAGNLFMMQSDQSPGDLQDFIDLLSALIREPSVVGAEDSFFRVLMRELQELGLTLTYYQGVLVAQGRDPESLILSAHVDRHGLLCTGPNEFQYSAFLSSNRSEQTGDSVSEQMMETIQHRFVGQRVQAHLPYTGTYLGQGTITHSFICQHRNNLIFEIDGLGFLQPGTPVSFLDRLLVLDGCVSGQLDNIVSVALLVYLFRKGFQGTALFTAQEEAGRSWRFALAWFLREQIHTRRLLVLDTSPYPTREAAEAQCLVLRHKDATAHFDPLITAELVEKCATLGLTYSFKDAYVDAQNETRVKKLSLGRTELGRLIAASHGQINGTTLQIPTTGYHTATETAALSSVRAAISLLLSYVRA
jgi:putative aminopeptidase FrvX